MRNPVKSVQDIKVGDKVILGYNLERTVKSVFDEVLIPGHQARFTFTFEETNIPANRWANDYFKMQSPEPVISIPAPQDREESEWLSYDERKH